VTEPIDRSDSAELEKAERRATTLASIIYQDIMEALRTGRVTQFDADLALVMMLRSRLLNFKDDIQRRTKLAKFWNDCIEDLLR
jgi:hypothetical protein